MKKHKGSAEHRFWLFDPEGDGMQFFPTVEERNAASKEAIQAYLDDGWSEEVGNVIAGEVTHLTTATNVVRRPETLDEDDHDEDGEYWPEGADFKCDYELVAIASEAAPRPEDYFRAGRILGESAAQEWIPCSERQPEKYGLHYLVAHRNGTVTDGEWIHSPITGKGAWSWANITHWKPLPKGPDSGSYVDRTSRCEVCREILPDAKFRCPKANCPSLSSQEER